MARRYEDFDEFCDPENPRAIKYEEVVAAADVIKPHVVHTPCFPSHHQREFVTRVYYKLESLQRCGSFKERGCVYALQKLPLDKKKIGIVIASLGNEAVGFCYHACKLNISVIVVMPIGVALAKLQKCNSLGAKVIVQGHNLMEAQKHARAISREKGMAYINGSEFFYPTAEEKGGRDHPHMLTGYGTVALEILEQVPFVEAVIVPIGSGGLAAAVGTVIKHVKPHCLVYGVQAENMPSLFKCLGEDNPYIITPVEKTIADAIAVPNVGVNSFETVRQHLDKMLLVNEDWIARAVLHMMERERLVVEGAGACPLATIIGSLVPELKLKTVVLVMSGGNIDGIALARCLERGLSAEGRLVKFKVGIQQTTMATVQLMRLLHIGGYNVTSMFRDPVWMEDDVPRVDVKLVCETKSLEHGLELKRIIERAYPYTSIFETEPFNDKRICPCYIKKACENKIC